MKFFHAIASQRRWKNRIVGLQNLEGAWQEDQKSIEGIIMEYFVAIFKLDHLTNFELVWVQSLPELPLIWTMNY